MNSLKVAATNSTRIGWRDEISNDHQLESEGFRNLKEAIKLAKESLENSCRAMNESNNNTKE